MSTDLVAWLGFFVALAAAVFTLLQYLNSKQLGERMLRLEEHRDQKSTLESLRAQLRHEIVPHPTDKYAYNLIVMNAGAGSAREVVIMLDAVPFYEHGCYFSPSSRPHKGPFKLSPGASHPLMLAPDSDTELPATITITWEDGTGQPGLYESPITV